MRDSIRAASSYSSGTGRSVNCSRLMWISSSTIACWMGSSWMAGRRDRVSVWTREEARLMPGYSTLMR